MDQKLVEYIREEFTKMIGTKTGWGKNEIMTIFEKAISNATLRFIDEQGEKS